MYMVFLKILKWHRMYYQISLFVLFFNFLFFFSFFINFVYNNYLFIIYSSLTHNNLGKLSLSWSFTTFYTGWAHITVKHISFNRFTRHQPAHFLIKFFLRKFLLFFLCIIKKAQYFKYLQFMFNINYFYSIITFISSFHYFLGHV